MERHGIRVFRIAERLAAMRGEQPDRELLRCAGLLHDLGIYEGASRGGVYVHDGALFARELLGGPGWPEERLAVLADAIECHHELRPQWSRGVEVETVRRADLVEVTNCAVRFGIDRAWYRALCRELPRMGFYRELGGLVAGMLKERPLTLPRIFLRR